MVTIEHDPDLADGAAAAITHAGYSDRVEVRRGDGALGAPDRAPFDAVIVTAGAVDIPPAWWDQLVDTGRMVVPLQPHPCGLTRRGQLYRTGPDTRIHLGAGMRLTHLDAPGSREHCRHRRRLCGSQGPPTHSPRTHSD